MSRPRELGDQVARLKAEVENLFVEECRIDDDIRELQENLRVLSEDENNQKWLYVTKEDINSLPCFQNETLIAIKAPHGTTLEVPDPDEVVDFPQLRYQIFLRSTMGPIDCYLVSKFEDRFDDMNQVPRPTEILGLSVDSSNDNNDSTLPSTVQGATISSDMQVQSQDNNRRISSDSASLEDFVDGILKIVPTDVNTILLVRWYSHMRTSINHILPGGPVSSRPTRPNLSDGMFEYEGDLVDAVVPFMGESITDGTLATFLKKPGDSVEIDETIAQIETDKVTIDVASPKARVIQEFVAKEGDIVVPGTKIAVISKSATGSPPVQSEKKLDTNVPQHSSLAAKVDKPKPKAEPPIQKKPKAPSAAPPKVTALEPQLPPKERERFL